MNYEKHYKALMNRSPKTRKRGLYLEKHRIIPGCMGGKYTKDNIAFLTPEEHYVAHQLLVKMYPDNIKLVFAAQMMSSDNGRSDRSSNKSYGWLRRKHSQMLKEKFASGEIKHANGMTGKTPWNKGKRGVMPSGKDHPNFGKKMPEFLKTLLHRGGKDPWNKGKTDYLSSETLEKMSKSHIGHADSEETKRKKSEKAKIAWQRRKTKDLEVSLNK